MKKRYTKNNSGFTIIETLVAISILVISITGPMVIVSQSLKSAYYARDQITVFYLAQEAIEYIRNVRDTNDFNGATDWLDGIAANSTAGGACALNQYGSNDNTCGLTRTAGGYSLASCSQTGATCDPLNYNPSTGVYGGMPSGAGNPPSAFTRTIYIMNVPKRDSSGNADSSYSQVYEVLVKVVVTWTSSVGKKNTFVLTEALTNWGL